MAPRATWMGSFPTCHEYQNEGERGKWEKFVSSSGRTRILLRCHTTVQENGPRGKTFNQTQLPVVVRSKENGGHLSLRFFRLFAVSLDEEMIAQSVGNLSPTIRLWGLWLLPGRGSLFVRRRDIKQRVAADLVGAPEFEVMLVTHVKVGTGFG